MFIVSFGLLATQNTEMSKRIADSLILLKGKALDSFSEVVLDGAAMAIADEKNPLRLNFFSTAMRMLFEHSMDSLSSVDAVRACSWFKSERDNGLPTRWQRVVYAIQGGLADKFVSEQLGVDPLPLRKRLMGAIDDLSKHVHGREDTVITEIKDQNAVATQVTAVVLEFFTAMQECRFAIVEPIEEALDSAAVDALLAETILEIDELSSHHSVEEIYVDKITVRTISNATVTFRATGTVGVTLQFGSNGDLRRGDGAEIEQSFPFYCDIETSVDDPWTVAGAETNFGVDTSEWYD